MSDDKRKNLAETLSLLSNEDKAWVINFLVQGLFSLSPLGGDVSSSSRRVAHVRRRDLNSPSDAQLEALFSGKDCPAVKDDEGDWSAIISANMGKTIKPIEKWL